MPKTKITPKMLEWAYDKWLEGYSLTAIAKALHVIPSRLRMALEGNGYTKELPDLHPPKNIFM